MGLTKYKDALNNMIKQYKNNSDKFLSYDEANEKYSYNQNNYYRTLICRNEDVYNHFIEYDEANKISLDETDTKFISKNVLFELFTNRYLFFYLINMLETDKVDALIIQYERKHTYITKAELGYALKQVHRDEIEEYSEDIKEVLYYLSSLYYGINYEVNHGDYKCIIDNEEVAVNISTLFYILNCSDKQFDDIVNRVENDTNKIILKDIDRIGLKEMFYMVNDFAHVFDIFKRCDMSLTAKDRFKKISTDSPIDYESINKYNKYHVEAKNYYTVVPGVNITTDIYHEEFAVNPDFLETVFKGIEPIYDDLEKALFVYIRLCDILSFKETEVLKPKTYVYDRVTPGDIKKIIELNNKVNSTEFMLLYYSILSMLGIKTNPDFNAMGGHNKEYARLQFRQAEYLVDMNIFNKDIINSDMSNVKLGRPIDGIKCINKNEITKKKFNEKLDMVYERYKQDNNIVTYTEDDSLTFEDKINMIPYMPLTGLELISKIKLLLSNEDVTYRVYYNNDEPEGLLIYKGEDIYKVSLGFFKDVTKVSNIEIQNTMALDEVVKIGGR